MASQAQLKKQQGMCPSDVKLNKSSFVLESSTNAGVFLFCFAELQTTYQNYKNTLQTIASKIGDIEQEAEEHK